MKTSISIGTFLGLALLLAIWGENSSAGGEERMNSLWKQAESLREDGNYQEAFEIYERLALDKDEDTRRVGRDLEMGISCLRNLGREHDHDSFRERIIAVHSHNWRLLSAAARSYFDDTHYGYIVAGEFHRGHHRGGGRYVNSFERDRIRALQLMEQALEASAEEVEQRATARLHLEFARVLMGYRGYGEAWRLQYLSDLGELPDYEEGYRYPGGMNRGAPVHLDGTPVYHRLPEGYRAARTDGERWRWMLARAVELDPNLSDEVSVGFADFLHQQFGVQTMAEHGAFLRDDFDDEGSPRAGTYALHTLAEDETIARLATGIRRFQLPDEFNFIRIYRRVGQDPRSGHSHGALRKLAQIFENRRQYDKAAEFWGHVGEPSRVDQILGNWGQFEPVATHPAGGEPTVEFRFRNGTGVRFQAHEIQVRELLDDVKEYVKSNPRTLDWQKVQISNVGYRLIQGDQTKYIGRKVAEWELALEPREHHFDKRVTITTPLKRPGAYLLTARMVDGNVSKIVIWVDDTVIAQQRLDKKAFFFVADAVTGEPLPKVNVEFFGFRQEATSWEKVLGRRYNVLTTAFAEYSDADGQVVLGPDEFDDDYQWMIVATTETGRLAYLGFSRVWYGGRHDREYNETKVFTITDRPVYRPNQPVRFKLWVRHAKYDQEDTSDFANRHFTVRIHNPKQEKVFETGFAADEYGGFDGEYQLPDDAALGVYSIQIPGLGGGSFRVEEYKKPEFEVGIEAPSDPVMLGEKITATVQAKYYFGAPVTKAKVRYKVLRSEHTASWYPLGVWDWFYGPGYWWFAYDYEWYPGWREWGLRRPLWWWWPTSRTPPEVVADAEVEIGADGTVEVEIDTTLAKELHGDADHRYEITAEVTDESRRTIVGKGEVLVARKPFQVYAWVDRGHYRVGDVIHASFSARTLDNKPVQGKGVLNLYRIQYGEDKPVEQSVQRWNLDTDVEGRAGIQIKASRAGQYRLSYRVTDARDHTIEGGYVFVIRGEGFDDKGFRFNEIEIVPDRREYAPGDTVRLLINTDREGSTVVLFVRPANGIYLKPKILRLRGKSVVEEIEVSRKDMPNFFVEAFTVANGKLFRETREIIVPPEKRVLNVKVLPSSESYKPGETGRVRIQLTDFYGKPFEGSAAISVYDKSVEYISGGSNVPDIKEFFWKWRRRHQPSGESSLDRRFGNLVPPNRPDMRPLGVFGHLVADEVGDERMEGGRGGLEFKARAEFAAAPAPALGLARSMEEAPAEAEAGADRDVADLGTPGAGVVEPVVRKDFADTALWVASLMTDPDGIAEVGIDMPENLTGWKIRTWAMGHGTKVGEGIAEAVTSKDLLLRLQAPRFFVERDEVVLSANIHNYLENAKSVRAALELDGGCLELLGASSQALEIEANGEKRVDWRVKVVREGEAVVRMKALTDEESDAMEMRFPVYVHGMLKTDSFSGVVRRDQNAAAFRIRVPEERRIDQSRLEIRYSPTLAGAMVDALPYLADYPYGCTEQTLSRFLPTVITQRILVDMGLDLKAIREKRTNLNAQETGDDRERAAQWKRFPRDPVFDEDLVRDMVKKGLRRLTAMQLSDGGWGWFSGWGERSYPHTTAYVVHGLQIAKQNGVAIVPGVLERGVEWLRQYEAGEVRKLQNDLREKDPRKPHADNLDAFVHMVLADAGVGEADMREFLYRDRNHLAVYGKALYGMALHRGGHGEERDRILRNIEQYLVRDEENQTAYLELPNAGYWWHWYGSEYEAQAYYLKLLAATDPKSDKAAGLVKYLLNNRKHATYWNSTRDTAICIEALSDYLRASGEDKPDMTVEIYIDGERRKAVHITAENLFAFDNKLVLSGDGIRGGEHAIEVRRVGSGPVYFNAYLTNFTLEDFITRAGLEIRVGRTYYRLVRADTVIPVAGSRGQAVEQRRERYEREELKNLERLRSGDLVEVELEIESKNDYEYLVFEDMKAAGFEPVAVRSGYGGNDLGAYMELRDERVVLFVRALARGRHSVAYRVRAEIPGRFSALPTRAYAMYAPELKANSDEIKLIIFD